MPKKQPLIVDCADVSQVVPNQPLLTSHQSGWSSIQLAHHRQPALELPEIANNQHTICIPTTHEIASLECVAEGRLQKRQFSASGCADGCFSIFPANLPYKLSWHENSEFTLCYLEPSFLAQIAYESVNPERVELTLEIKRSDLLIYQIGFALKQNLEIDGVSSRFYADSMSTALSAHLLKHYSTRKHDFRDYDDGLSKQKLRQAVEYIHEHLGENLSLSAIASELHMSQYYFCRLFKRSTGVTPHQYLIQQRIEQAKQLLKRPELTVTAVALKCGFSNQSHLAKQFRKHTGMTPNRFRNL